MKKFSVSFLLVACLFLLSCCSSGPGKKDYILKERDLIPEGTAFDNRTGTIYIGSTFKRKIIQITSDGAVSDFIPEKQNGITGIVGMEVDENTGTLWVNTAHANEVMPLKDPHPAKDWMTSICSFDIQTRKLIKQYDLPAEKSFLNDLTVLPNGDVIATETVNSKLYRINKKTDAIEGLLDLKGFPYANGITWSDKFNCLYVACEQGILQVDPLTKNYFLLQTPPGVDAGSIDGLAFYKDRLIGHQSSKVSAFYLNEDGQAIVRAETLDTGKEFDSSTTGEIGGEDYYFIVNSQVRSGIDTVTKTIKPVDRLNDVIIRKIKL